MDYQKMLEYYLTSDTWRLRLEMFMEDYELCYDPFTGTDHAGRIWLCSEIYMRLEERLGKDGGVPCVELPTKKIIRIFDHRYSETQRFAVVFGLWWGLKEPAIHAIADLRQKKKCRELLYYFLCVPDGAMPPDKAAVRDCRYDGPYWAELYDPSPINLPKHPRDVIPVGKEYLADTSKLLAML